VAKKESHCSTAKDIEEATTPTLVCLRAHICGNTSCLCGDLILVLASDVHVPTRSSHIFFIRNQLNRDIQVAHVHLNVSVCDSQNPVI
jgi:hypothetical protein